MDYDAVHAEYLREIVGKYVYDFNQHSTYDAKTNTFTYIPNTIIYKGHDFLHPYHVHRMRKSKPT